MKTLGICFGSTTIQCVQLNLENNKSRVIQADRITHEGNPRTTLVNYLKAVSIKEFDRIAVTGRSFRTSIRLTSISEPQAVEAALKYQYKDGDFPELLVSSGGETQLVYLIDKNGCINSVHSGNKCASGTGEFFLQQIRRMGLNLEEAVELASVGTPHKIAGRCSVFCKSDCTHALNKGEPRANVAAGLCLMMADKISELVKDIQFEKAALIGGGSLNKAMVKILNSRFNQLDIPDHAECFEAYGAALWASENQCLKIPSNLDELFVSQSNSFGVHPPLKQALDLVDFKELSRGTVNDNDSCILGLDVGSTTTKAVLINKDNLKILASVYLRTNGDPVNAARNCYKEIQKQIAGTVVRIEGLGVTGSGRQIAALHALSKNVINEIVAHATAAAFFDNEVDTIFEIGGQDAKYTYLTGGIPSDYAMNEACSAGTGSFLEESARESLNVLTEEIGDLALAGQNPPNFTDQCSAFISSDIKIASQEGVGKNDLLAGLVYSICLNYLNRVKSSRPVGKKIFMQGGVCYNRAVPVAMASLMNCKVIVPPDPGLMGGFGVALEVKTRIDAGISDVQLFDLQTLIDREAKRENSFICAGGADKCDRKCEISRIRINETLFPFGGICNKYYNLRLNKQIDSNQFDLVDLRQKLIYEKYGVISRVDKVNQDKPERTVGILKSFLTHSLFPLYSNFFDQLGFRVVLSDEIDREGISRIEAAFCLPAEITHGSFYNLLKKKPDYIFIPQVMQIPVPNVQTFSRMCVFVQGEPYYLKATFRKELEQSPTVILSAVLKMENGYEAAEDTLVDMVNGIGVSEKIARKAYQYACRRQYDFENELLEIGRETLKKLDDNPELSGIVLFGRPYNAFADDANMGIPHKVASRGYYIIPNDMIPSSHINVHHKMFWATGQKIMKSAQIVKERKNLFGFYITNFSCGPDSFLLGYFRRLMGEKPSLTLELDQHTADAGIDTRIEAALDIISSYRKLGIASGTDLSFKAAKIINKKKIKVVSSKGIEYDLTDPNVEIVIPSMGRCGTEVAAAIFRSIGINGKALPVADKNVLLEGRKNTTCKECLPYILTTGSFLEYVKQREGRDKISLFFMATGGGPCRLGQYCVALEHQIEKWQIPDAAVLTVTDENGYGGMGARTLLKAWMGIIISDVLNDIKSVLKVAAVDKDAALNELESLWQELLSFFEGIYSIRLTTLLENIASRLASIPLKKDPDKIPVISLIGEIYVRREEFSRKNIVDYLEDHGFAVRVAPVAEYMCYSNYVLNTGLSEKQFSLKEQLKLKLTAQIQEWWECHIKTILAKSGLYKFEMIDVAKTIKGASHLLNENFRGEAILTVGLGLREILNDSCGVISIGPFGCMPSRVAEAILKKEMNMEGKERMQNGQNFYFKGSQLNNFPFLAIETDGSPFPQLIEANLEAFILQAQRIHQIILNNRKGHTHSSRKNLSVLLYDLVTGNGKKVKAKGTK
ncbi:MAG TPA: acyl-CoA dehydratase activase [Chitinispirillaceae bacterium]|nr:acyl-CoA dehydratase activase [Chitinispirillaceae bacterium]